MSELVKKAEKFKYPLLVLLVGLALVLLPSGSRGSAETADENGLLQEILSCSDGVGTAKVLISDSGVVVVCEGAASAAVRLDIIHAVSSYTGFGSDKITILKLA